MKMNSFKNHLIASMYRRMLIYWNSKYSLVIKYLLAILLANVLWAFIPFITKFIEADKTTKLPISKFNRYNLTFARISNKNCSECDIIQQKFSNASSYLIRKQFQSELQFLDFESFEDYNHYLQELYKNPKNLPNIPAAFQIVNDSAISILDGKPYGNFKVKCLLNRSFGQGTEEFFNRALLNLIFSEIGEKVDIKAEFKLRSKGKMVLYSDFLILMDSFLPYFMPFALLYFSSIFLRHINNDIKTPVRPYMISCGLSKLAYWLGNFVVDSILLLIFTIIVSIIYFAARSISFGKFIIFLIGMVCSLSTLAFTYIWGLIGKGAIGIFLYMTYNIILLLVCCFYPNVFIAIICPFANWLRIFMTITDQMSNSFLFDEVAVIHLSFLDFFPILLNFIICPLLVYLAEIIIKKYKPSKEFYLSHMNELQTIKDSLSITEEALEMEKDVMLNEDNYAIRILDVCKIFNDGSTEPIYAVNQVSLGIKKHSVFGFLGANGAGKTTLIKMILKEIPVSSGTIEINGENIDTSEGVKVVVCPQFDDHLTPQLTCRQNMKFFSYLFNKSGEESDNLIERVIEVLDYSEHVDKRVEDLSGGNRRKLSASIPFLSNCNVVLLDEPTSSLDPISRRHLHQLINMNKTGKTIMLCTHLLDEAENLCDNISIMANGCIFAYGTPQYLSHKFGKEWKIDIMLTDDTIITSQKVKTFIRKNIPQAVLSVDNKTSLIYSVPNEEYSITKLFSLVQKGKNENIGIKFFTCSCSTLDKAFMEIVMRSQLKKHGSKEIHDNTISIDSSIGVDLPYL